MFGESDAFVHITAFERFDHPIVVTKLRQSHGHVNFIHACPDNHEITGDLLGFGLWACDDTTISGCSEHVAQVSDLHASMKLYSVGALWKKLFPWH